LFLAAAAPPLVALIGILALSRFFGRESVAAGSPIKAV
jgi:xanthosine utilization system XapX-like protein